MRGSKGWPSRTESSWILSVSYASIAVIALGSVLWFLRAHYFNATNAGWGDPEQDRHQWLLGWGVRASAIIALVSVAVIASTSKRAFISITTGLALSGVIAVAGTWLPIVGVILGFPGFFASLYSFGVHSAGTEITAFAVIVNASVYGVATFLSLRSRTL